MYRSSKHTYNITWIRTKTEEQNSLVARSAYDYYIRYLAYGTICSGSCIWEGGSVLKFFLILTTFPPLYNTTFIPTCSVVYSINYVGGRDQFVRGRVRNFSNRSLKVRWL